MTEFCLFCYSASSEHCHSEPVVFVILSQPQCHSEGTCEESTAPAVVLRGQSQQLGFDAEGPL